MQTSTTTAIAPPPPTMQTCLDMGAFYHALHLQLTLSGGEGTQSCGEDAYFISKRKNMMGISDGVSAWSAYGLGNSGYLAFYLMSNARVAAEKRDIIDTERLVNDSFESVWDLHDNKLVTIPNGSATITTLKLHQDPTTLQPYIKYSNLGDCMVMVLRPEKLDENNINLRIMHVSKKLYSFHEHARGVPVPLQLVFYPAQGRKLSTEQSAGVETEVVPVQEDDMIILATDGLWDNLMNDDVVRIVANHYSNAWKASNNSPPLLDSQGVISNSLPSSLPHLVPSEVARRLVEEALRMNLKPDDITCIVGIVSKSLSSSSSSSFTSSSPLSLSSSSVSPLYSSS